MRGRSDRVCMINRHISIILFATPLTLLSLTGCQRELSRTKPWWEELQDASAADGQVFAADVRSGVDATATGPNDIKPFTIRADGSTDLNTQSPEYLISHLNDALIEEKYDLLYDELISDEIKQTYLDVERDPQEIITWMQSNRRDALDLIRRMGGGLNSSDIVWNQRGPTIRLELIGRASQQVRFKSMDIIREQGEFKLMVIQ